MSTVFWWSTMGTVIFVFWIIVMEPINAHTSWWPCWCWKWFLSSENQKKKLKILRCPNVLDVVLRYCSDIIEGKLIQLLFYFLILVIKVVSFIGISFFICGSGSGVKFSRVAVLRKRLQLVFKTELTSNVDRRLPAIAGIFASDCVYFWLILRIFSPEIAGIFA